MSKFEKAPSAAAACCSRPRWSAREGSSRQCRWSGSSIPHPLTRTLTDFTHSAKVSHPRQRRSPRPAAEAPRGSQSLFENREQRI